MTNELRFVGCQVALVTGALTIGRSWPVAVGLGACAAAVMVISTARFRGDWLSSVLAVRLCHSLRGRTHDVGNPAYEPETLFGLLAPGARVGTGDFGGLLSMPSELVAVLRPTPSAELLSFSSEGIAGQLVLHAGPARDRTPRAWLALRALRDPTVFEDRALSAMLSNVLRRRFKGVDVLSHKDICSTVVALTHTGSGRGLLHESWSYWRAGSVVQSGFRLAGFDGLGAGKWPLLCSLLDAAPGVALTASVTTGGEGGALMRIAATSHTAVGDAALELAHICGPRGVRLERLDGRHARAVAATLPIGGESL
jgi:hypothetical protein